MTGLSEQHKEKESRLGGIKEIVKALLLLVKFS